MGQTMKCALSTWRIRPGRWPDCLVRKNVHTLNCRKYVGFRAASCVRRFHGLTVTATARTGPKNEKTPSGEGVSSFLVTDFQELSVDVSSGGGGNCTRVPLA